MTTVFINEFHYDNTGTDAGEFIEIVGPAGTDLTGWQIVRYNGANGLVYTTPAATETLSGIISDQGNGYGTVVINYPSNGIQNGAPDGLALVDNSNTVVQFISYEGSFTAVDGIAAGLTSIDIGISQNGTEPIGASLQLTGTGSVYEDFTWTATTTNTSGAINSGQTFTGVSSPGVTIAQSGNSTEVNEQGETTDTYTIALNTVPSSPVAIAIAADGQTQVSIDGVNFFDSVNLELSDTTPATVTVRAVNDTAEEGSPHTGVITHTATSADPDYNGLTISNLNVNILDNDVALAITPIHTLQGSGSATPLTGTAAQNITVEAIVVGDFQGTDGLDGFYIQEESTDADADPLTSEGIFVFAPGAVDVKVGDKVLLTGDVSEQFGQTQLSNLDFLSIEATDQLSLVSPTSVDLSVTPNSQLERYEGMLVTFTQTLTVTEHFQLGRFGQVLLSSIGVQQQPTDFIDPNDASPDGNSTSGSGNVAAITAQQLLNTESRIFLDDGSNVAFPTTVPFIDRTSGDETLRIGSTFNNLTGVLGYAFGAYRVQRNPDDPTDGLNTEYPLDVDYAPRPDVPEVSGGVKVASFNVLNYFTTIDTVGGNNSPRGADSAAEFARQQAKIVAALLELDADVVGLIEMENNGATAISNLVDALNAEAGAEVYDFIADPTDYTSVPGGDDAIKVAFIYKPAVVTPLGEARTWNDDAFANGRAPVAQTFVDNATGEVFTPIINHFKSKSGTGTGADADQGDGQGNFNESRRQQAAALLDFVADLQAETGDGDVMVIGDLNAYSQEDPIDVLRAGGLTKLETGVGYLFDGQVGSLDHALVTASLLSQVTGAAKWNVNAFEPNALDYNDNILDSPGEGGSNPPLNNDTSLYQPDSFRSSDHDPVLVGLDLLSELTTINGTRRDDNLVGTNSRNQIFGGIGDDIIDGLAASDTIEGGQGGDIIYGGFGNDILAADQVNRFQDASGTVSELYGDQGNDTLYGGDKNDLMEGGADNDVLYGKAGDDQMLGGTGDDLLNGGLGNDLVNGGAGIDTADYADLTFGRLALNVAGLDVNLSTGTVFHSSSDQALTWTDTLIGIEHVVGTNRNDRFIGDENDNLFDGRSQLSRSVSFTDLDGDVYSVTGDVVEYSGLKNDFAIAGTTSQFTVSGTGIGTDTLKGIEFLKFDDGVFAVSTVLA